MLGSLHGVWIGGALAIVCALPAAAGMASVGNIVVDARSAGVINTFDPLRTIGAAVDSQTTGAIETIYAPPDVRAMLSTGLGPVSYRLYTELSVQHWHWNPVGTWSDRRGEGYWRGATTLGPPIVNSFGYRLAHRGFTHDQGNDDTYGRLDDGNVATYWKSDPYLAHPFTHEPDADHPQWALVDLGALRPVDAIRLTWTAPYATTYAVQYWTGTDAINDPAHGRWATFRDGAVDHGHGGIVTLRLDDRPVRVRYVRILMSVSSNTCDTHGSGDIRDCVGFALAELGLGTLTPGGGFADLVRHEPSKRQTPTYVSSVDPWHAPQYRVLDQEQPGLDVVFRSGVNRGQPTMLPVGMLYGTPDDAAGEIRYVEANGYPISYVELGEEPDGQYIAPEDYAALYLQWARALHAVDPALKLGGPVFQGATSDVPYWPNADGNVSWLQRFLAYLRVHGGTSELAFMSFEHYPFDSCGGSVQHNVLAEAGVVRSIVDIWHRDGIPRSLPLFITEMNYSPDFGAVPQDIAGALWYADAVGAFLSAGGAGVYLYEYEPTPMYKAANCASFGALNPWNADAAYHVRQPTAQFFLANLLMRAWALPVDAMHALHTARADFGADGSSAVAPYVLERPDHTWSALVVNNDLTNAHAATVTFLRSNGRRAHFAGPITVMTFSPADYVWHPNGTDGFAQPDGPPARAVVPGTVQTRYSFPAASITVLSGAIR